MADVNEHRFIFLCGLHRSGTSPLFRILRDHPQISGFRNTGVPEDEGQHLQSVYASARIYGGPGRFGFSRDAHMTESSALCNARNAQLLFKEWAALWDTSRDFLLEKSPPNLIRTRFLQACFPHSYFIVIVRHPIAVSLATLKWSRQRLSCLLEHWHVCHQLFEADRQYLRNVLVVRYEDLCAMPTSSLQLIKEFLRLDSGFDAELDRRANQRYFDTWRLFGQSACGKVIHNELIARYEDYFRTYGYSLAEPGALLPSHRVASANCLALPA